MTEERLKQLSMQVDCLTPAMKKEIREAVKELGVTMSFKSSCTSCYQDALGIIWHSMTHHKTLTDSGKYYYLKGRTEYWNGRIPLNEHTPDAIIEEVMTLHKGFFEPVPEEE